MGNHAYCNDINLDALTEATSEVNCFPRKVAKSPYSSGRLYEFNSQFPVLVHSIIPSRSKLVSYIKL